MKPRPPRLDRRQFLASVATAAGAAVVIDADRATPPDRPILVPKVRWIGHC